MKKTYNLGVSFMGESLLIEKYIGVYGELEHQADEQVKHMGEMLLYWLGTRLSHSR